MDFERENTIMLSEVLTTKLQVLLVIVHRTHKIDQKEQLDRMSCEWKPPHNVHELSTQRKKILRESNKDLNFLSIKWALY